MCFFCKMPSRVKTCRKSLSVLCKKIGLSCHIISVGFYLCCLTSPYSFCFHEVTSCRVEVAKILLPLTLPARYFTHTVTLCLKDFRHHFNMHNPKQEDLVADLLCQAISCAASTVKTPPLQEGGNAQGKKKK